MFFVQHPTFPTKLAAMPLFDWLVCKVVLGSAWSLGGLDKGEVSRVPKMGNVTETRAPMEEDEESEYESDETLELTDDSDSEEEKIDFFQPKRKPFNHIGSPKPRARHEYKTCSDENLLSQLFENTLSQELKKEAPNSNFTPDFDFTYQADYETESILVGNNPRDCQWISYHRFGDDDEVERALITLATTEYNRKETNPPRFSSDWMNSHFRQLEHFFGE